MAIPRSGRQRRQSRAGARIRKDVEVRPSSADRTRTHGQKSVSVSSNHKSDNEKSWSSGLPDAFAEPKQKERAKQLAIDAMRDCGVIAEACRRSGIGRRTIYQWMKADPDFKRRIADAHRDNLDKIELAMRDRAQWGKGQLDGIFILKHNRKKYREVQRVELTGKDGAPVAYTDAKGELLARLARMTERTADAIAVAGASKPQLVTESGIEVRKLPKGFNSKLRK